MAISDAGVIERRVLVALGSREHGGRPCVRAVEVRLTACVFCRGQEDVIRAVQDSGSCQTAGSRCDPQCRQQLQRDADTALPALFGDLSACFHSYPFYCREKRNARCRECTCPPCSGWGDVYFHIRVAALCGDEELCRIIFPQLFPELSVFSLRMGLHRGRLCRAVGEFFSVCGETVLNGGRDGGAEPFAIQLLGECGGRCADDTLHTPHISILWLLCKNSFHLPV